jgi:hypothetical protein
VGCGQNSLNIGMLSFRENGAWKYKFAISWLAICVWIYIFDVSDESIFQVGAVAPALAGTYGSFMMVGLHPISF